MANNKKKLEGADFFTSAAAPRTPAASTATASSSTAKKKTARPSSRPLAQKTGSVTACFKIDAALLARLKAAAYWARRKNKDILEEALADYLDKYEAENGPIDVDIPRNLA